MTWNAVKKLPRARAVCARDLYVTIWVLDRVHGVLTALIQADVNECRVIEYQQTLVISIEIHFNMYVDPNGVALA